MIHFFIHFITCNLCEFYYRLYDREGNGYITTGTLKEILKALDDNLSSRELDGIIAEIDTDGSGTVDFDGKIYSITNNIQYIVSKSRALYQFIWIRF